MIENIKNTAPNISIITPVYNSAPYISDTIKSVLGQTLQNWEMIIVDDGSTDKTSDIVKAFSDMDERIRYYKLDHNSGRPAVPRNYAVAQARGEYLAFLDSDDIWLPDKLDYQLKYMKKYDLDFCYGPTLTSKGWKIDPKGFGKRKHIIKWNFIPCITVMIRKKNEYLPLFDEEPFLKASEDYFAWMRLYHLTNKIGCYDQCLSIYRNDRNDNILKEYNKDTCKRMAQEYLLFSKAYLSGILSKREILSSYCRIFLRNVLLGWYIKS